MKRIPWMYNLVSSNANPDTLMWECPLCFALVKHIKDHTKYHEDKGENDENVSS